MIFLCCVSSPLVDQLIYNPAKKTALRVYTRYLECSSSLNVFYLMCQVVFVNFDIQFTRGRNMRAAVTKKKTFTRITLYKTLLCS